MNYFKLKTVLSASKYFPFIILPGYLFVLSCTQHQQPMKIVSEDAMVQNFYADNDSNQFWFSSNKNMKKANEWLDALDLSNTFEIGRASCRARVYI